MSGRIYWGAAAIAVSLFLFSQLSISPSSPQAALAYLPDQAEEGARVYAQWCSSCHGDGGQGLTPEWRATWPETHRNCSAPYCHGTPRLPEAPPIINNYAPAVIGPQALTRFATAQDLYDLISVSMPLSWPGHLSAEEYWALTAFLLRENGVLPDGILLDAATAPALRLGPASASESSEAATLYPYLALGLVGVTALLGLLAWRRRGRRSAR